MNLTSLIVSAYSVLGSKLVESLQRESSSWALSTAFLTAMRKHRKCSIKIIADEKEGHRRSQQQDFPHKHAMKMPKKHCFIAVRYSPLP